LPILSSAAANTDGSFRKLPARVVDGRGLRGHQVLLPGRESSLVGPEVLSKEHESDLELVLFRDGVFRRGQNSRPSGNC
jgi:hypothetical protein